MDSNGLQWTPMDSNGLQWTPMDSNGLQWTPMDSNGLQWTPMDFNGLQWTPMDSNGLQWSAPLSSRHAISNLYLQWPPMDSNGLQSPRELFSLCDFCPRVSDNSCIFGPGTNVTAPVCVRSIISTSVFMKYRELILTGCLKCKDKIKGGVPIQ